MPKIVIIIPVYNKEKFIAETLTSVLNQNFQDWECLLVDDGSTDSSAKICSEFEIKDSRFKFVKRSAQRTKGASTCRNIGLEQSSSNFVQFLDADDVLSPNKLKDQVALIEQDDKIDLITCKWGRMGNGIEEIYENFPSYNDFDHIPDFLNSLVSGSRGYFPLHAYLIKRKIIECAGPWNECLSMNDDGEFMMRVIANSRRVKFSPTAKVWYRLADENNLSRSANKIAVNKAIYGMKITDAYLALHFGKEHYNFMLWSKNQFFVFLKNKAPELIQEHQDFFSEQIKSRKIVNRIGSKLKKLTQ